MCFTWTSRVLGSVDAVCVTRAFCCEVFSVYSSFRALANCVRCWCFLVMVMVNIKAAFIIHTQRIKGPLGLYIPFESSNQVVHNYSAHLFFYAACFRAEGYDAASRRRPGGVESHLVLLPTAQLSFIERVWKEWSSWHFSSGIPKGILQMVPWKCKNSEKHTDVQRMLRLWFPALLLCSSLLLTLQ